VDHLTSLSLPYPFELLPSKLSASSLGWPQAKKKTLSLLLLMREQRLQEEA
jgi:hypothetical protein